MNRRNALITAFKGLAFIGASAIAVKASEPELVDSYKMTVSINTQQLEDRIVQIYRKNGELRSVVRQDVLDEAK